LARQIEGKGTTPHELQEGRHYALGRKEVEKREECGALRLINWGRKNHSASSGDLAMGQGHRACQSTGGPEPQLQVAVVQKKNSSNTTEGEKNRGGQEERLARPSRAVPGRGQSELPIKEAEPCHGEGICQLSCPWRTSLERPCASRQKQDQTLQDGPDTKKKGSTPTRRAPNRKGHAVLLMK